MEKCLNEWNVHRYVRKQDREVLKTALKENIDRIFTPITVCSQVVDGTNYMFICGSTSDISKLKVELVKVYIYVPVEGKPKLKSIEKMQ
ncbi:MULTISPECIES: hypothetical protein [Clostridium]|uniref:Uncharacterized protein n=1 Tax=Clostridium aquiflavi TaxID=3073603 RepID=A0ABU1EH27_9CLOT|nr:MULTISPECIES: hypothetical protein [unclassified Clostridium]MDR5587259.1 hypothetical protein [Clostridium sp. 5N-1]NFG62211.1 hypothetical protein [Clostridium botulinum]NFQ09547.1 hypothetical protein [Clostridium botulinum]